MRQVLAEEATPRTRLIELPGRGATRVWECAGPPGAETLMLIHGVACTAELNWGKVFAPLAAHFRVVAADLRGHGDGIRAGSRFRLEDCADDVAALAAVLGTGKFTAVGYSMGGMVAQLVYRRHASLLSGLVLCSTAGNVGSPAQKLAAFALPARRRPAVEPGSAAGQRRGPGIGAAGSHRRPGHRQTGPRPAAPDHARQRRLGHPGRRPVQLGRLDQPGRRPRRSSGHDPGPHRAGRPSARAGPGDPRRIGPRDRRRSRGMHHRAADLRPNAAQSLLVGTARPRPR